MFLESLLVIISILLYYIISKYSKRLPANVKYPNGPISLPIIGGLYRIDKNDILGSLEKLKQQYGDVYSIKFGSINTIVLSDIKSIEKAYKDHSDSFNDRPQLNSFYLLGNGSNISFSNSIYWKKIRGILNNLLTASKIRLSEDFINQEYIKAELYLKKKIQVNNIIEMKSFIKLFQINIVYRFLFGTSFEYDDNNQDTQALLKHATINDQLVEYLSNQVSDFIPLFRLFTSHKDFANRLNNNIKFYKPLIQKRINKMDNLEEPTCLLDNIILELRKDSGSKVIDINFMEFIVFDLIVSSEETTLSTFSWLFLYLVNNQDIQDQLSIELCSTPDYPTLKEKRNYPLFNAVVKETQRISPTVPLALPRFTTQDTIIDQYYIPKGTQIIPNLYSVSHNENQFNDPNTFNPFRYLNSASSTSSLKDLTFSTGPRGCPGVHFANDEIFLITSKLLKNFKFERTTTQKYNEDGRLNITYKPKPYLVKVTSRL